MVRRLIRTAALFPSLVRLLDGHLHGPQTLSAAVETLILVGRAPGVVQSLIIAGYNGGAWNGAGGITSANAAAASSTSHKTALGYSEATDAFTTFNATFSGRSVDNTSILIRYTASGDANLDGKFDQSDLDQVTARGHFNDGTAYHTWTDGDMNFDARGDTADFGAGGTAARR